VEELRAELAAADDPDAFLRSHADLPGPRANLELAAAAVPLATDADVERRLGYADTAEPNTPDEFVVFCGVVALGPRLAQGKEAALALARGFAGDERWRLREAVAIALQTLGDADPGALVAIAREWVEGTPYERRAAVAALCEPRLLGEPATLVAALDVLDSATASLAAEPDRRDPGVVALRKALSYGWSVAVAAAPETGRPRFERWLASDDRDVRRILRDNLGKARLGRADPEWVERTLAAL
jgi:hypothetical protein